MKNLTFANRYNSDLIDEQYDLWVNNPQSVDSDWRAFFEGFVLAQDLPKKSSGSGAEASIINAINAYRTIGHTQAKINPLVESPEKNPRLSAKALGISDADLKKDFFTGDYLDGKSMKANEILNKLEKTYCGSIGFEFTHIQDDTRRKWLQDRIEKNGHETELPKKKKIRTLRKVIRGENFERFLHTRYVGQKRFSLEGGETLIPAMDALLEACPKEGVEEVIIGMAHRGRLNVLANIMGKSYDFIFREFTENYVPESIYGDGDVKYHLGFENVHKTESGHEIQLALAPNPSHLEAVNPVVEGKARARQRIRGDIPERKKVVPLLIHGDAALIGQGIVAEVLNFSKLEGYSTGGTIHIVINNQIGFTTAPEQGRSSRYCTDIGKMIDAPVFHVNGDDPLAVVWATEVALQYRQTFGDDVFIDMYCYRKHGHNETDEPAFTQPLLYKKISKHPCVSELLTDRLIKEGTMTEKEGKDLHDEFEAILNDAFEKNKKEREEAQKRKPKPAQPVQPHYDFKPVKTAVDSKTFKKVAKGLTEFPKDFKVNPKIKRQFEAKKDVLKAGEGYDWGYAELLAYGTLLLDGTPVRLSGQDCERGTFSHRHAVLYDVETRERYVPLMHLEKKQATFCVHNSSLSEAAVLGFDYGYSLDYPEMLALWEAQFGDFANGAQTIIDQFLVSSESKWQTVSGLTLLLPHGYEGQGPEHSSARLERFLQACAEDNIQVCNVTTPAQLFHLLRRQMKRAFKKPLILMSPKSLLRHKLCVSHEKDFTEGSFETIYDDTAPAKKTERVILCSGKVYYDLIAHREDNKIKDTTIVRIEQLYPLDNAKLDSVLKKYKSAKKFVWCQEEPKNMGAAAYILPILIEKLGIDHVHYAGRRAAASPAVGALAKHKVEQQTLIEKAFNL